MKRISIRRMYILFAMAFIMALGIVPVNAQQVIGADAGLKNRSGEIVAF